MAGRSRAASGVFAIDGERRGGVVFVERASCKPMATICSAVLRRGAMRAPASAAGVSRSREVVKGSDIAVSRKQNDDEEFLARNLDSRKVKY